jgi:hypothetical protein
MLPILRSCSRKLRMLSLISCDCRRDACSQKLKGYKLKDINLESARANPCSISSAPWLRRAYRRILSLGNGPARYRLLADGGPPKSIKELGRKEKQQDSLRSRQGVPRRP